MTAEDQGTVQTSLGRFELDLDPSVNLLSSWSAEITAVRRHAAESQPQAAGPALSFDPAGDARLLRGISLGLLQDGADPSAQDDAAPIPEPPDWRFEPYVAGWLPLKLKGNVTMRGTVTNVNVDLDTLIGDLEWVVEGGFQLTNDQW